ncbi:MAG: DUF3078 domain-containing protein [Lewinellaceae bacterium]|nr:DUF3078 domain-containing protein [Lewinella sp.]MCB9279048.1 DUF3078 domain-containing protein [Lewinellaceae bacterium]
MKNITSAIAFFLLSVSTMHAQNMDTLLSHKADLQAVQAMYQGKVDSLQGLINKLNGEIEILSGWQKGLSGTIGFDFNKSSNWVSSPNPDAGSTSLNIGVTAFANKISRKSFWRNKALINKSWQDVDLSKGDMAAEKDGLFENGTVDILNVSSLFGLKLGEHIAISTLGELNTSVENFFNPGTFDIGAGVTWTPASSLVVVIHPLNYHYAFSGVDDVKSTGSLGAKVRADFTKNFHVGGKNVAWSSTVTTFIPYKEKDPTLFEYTWINSLSFQVWKAIGVGVGFGVRNAEFESKKVQSYYSLGLSYNFQK